MIKSSDLFINESDYADLNIDGAVSHLRGAIQCATVSYVDTSRIDYTQFDRLHTHLRASYPHVVDYGTWEVIGKSLLITLPGSDASLKPALFMAHQDVVPIIPGTEGDWLHDPFSGDVADGYIWGRGAIDIKQMLIAELESAEYLLSQGHTPRRTVYLAFGEDEETCSVGVRVMEQALRNRGVTLEFVLDEGAGASVTDAADWGAPGALISAIGVYEKGYADLQLSVQSRGGHSSNPFHGTSLGLLADGIHAITHHMPPAVLQDSVKQSLLALRGQITAQPMRDWCADIDAHEADILNWFLNHESLYHLVRTTAAPTMITPGAPAGNVMPQDMQAVINFRLIPQDTPESLMERFEQLVPPQVSLKWVQQINASTPSDTGLYGFAAFRDVLSHYFDRLTFIPAQNKGATDARHYESLCRCVMRYGPFLEETDIITQGMHGTNERVSIRAFAQGIRVITRFMQNTCFSGD